MPRHPERAIRILLILAVGALILALFENWRYRATNEDFKTLFERADAEKVARNLVALPHDDLWRALIESSLITEGFLKFSHQTFTYSWVTAHPNALRPQADLEFSITKPLGDSEKQELDRIIRDTRAKSNATKKYEWRISTNFSSSFASGQKILRIFISSRAPVTGTESEHSR